MALTMAPKDLGPHNPTKNLAHRVDLNGQPLSQKYFPKNCGPYFFKQYLLVLNIFSLCILKGLLNKGKPGLKILETRFWDNKLPKMAFMWENFLVEF